MKTHEELKSIVKEKYGEIANKNKSEAISCCSGICCDTEESGAMSEDYSNLKGFNPDADLGLGCGLPTQYAGIKKGDTVVDLGSGAGNDCFVARAETGDTGKVIGIDFTPEMIEIARKNAALRSFHNVEFRHGDIED